MSNSSGPKKRCGTAQVSWTPHDTGAPLPVARAGSLVVFFLGLPRGPGAGCGNNG